MLKEFLELLKTIPKLEKAMENAGKKYKEYKYKKNREEMGEEVKESGDRKNTDKIRDRFNSSLSVIVCLAGLIPGAMGCGTTHHASGPIRTLCVMDVRVDEVNQVIFGRCWLNKEKGQYYDMQDFVKMQKQGSEIFCMDDRDLMTMYDKMNRCDYQQ